MLYRTMKRIIERGLAKTDFDAEGVYVKLDIFFAADRLSAAEYTELAAMLETE